MTTAIIPTTANTAMVSRPVVAGAAEMSSGAGAMINSGVGALSITMGRSLAILSINIILFQVVLHVALILYQSIEQSF
ncbi:MAG: hypothetical protein JRI49_08375 [Deltaproteobacteria bacterium]|nr:hypothetical protein [Deltaproteobacteria bacterium]